MAALFQEVGGSVGRDILILGGLQDAAPEGIASAIAKCAAVVAAIKIQGWDLPLHRKPRHDFPCKADTRAVIHRAAQLAR